MLLFRASLAALIILGITGAANLVPPSLGRAVQRLSLHRFSAGADHSQHLWTEQAHTIIKNLPTGLWALVLYTLTISFAYPRWGIYWGTLAGFAVATVYLLALAYWNGRRPRIKIDPVGPEVIPGKRI